MLINILSCLQPDACQTDFDAVSMIRGELFFFKSGFVWRIRDGHLESGYPALASRHWRGIPDNVDAAFEDKSGNIWFFQGEQRGHQLLTCGLWFLTSTRPVRCCALSGKLKHMQSVINMELQSWKAVFSFIRCCNMSHLHWALSQPTLRYLLLLAFQMLSCNVLTWRD